jgi:putative hydrolase of the HAD superfamily
MSGEDRMTPYQSVVFFDLDGTLIVNPFEAAVWPVVMGEIAEKAAVPLQTVRDLIIEENALRQNNPYVSATSAMDWDDIAGTVASRLGVTLDSRCVDLVCANALAHSAILDDGADVLRGLTAPYRALVVATKGLAKYQQPVLDALELTPLFTAVLTPDTHSALKKSPAFFGDWATSTRLQIMVGDRYDDDVEAPGSYGFKTVWKPETLDPTLHKKDPFARALLYDYSPDQKITADAIILSLQELPAVVRRLELSVLGYTD